MSTDPTWEQVYDTSLSLRERWNAYIRYAGAQQRKTTRHVALVLGASLMLLYAILRLMIWRIGVDAAESGRLDRLSEAGRSISLDALSLHDAIQEDLLNASFLWVALPLCLVIIAVYWCANRVMYAYTLRIYNRPALARAVIDWDREFLSTYRSTVNRLLVALTVLFAGGIIFAGVAPRTIDYRTYASIFLGAGIALILLLWLGWIIVSHRKRRGRIEITLAFARRACVAIAARVAVLFVGIVAIILAAWILASAYSNYSLDVRLSAWRSEFDAWTLRYEQHVESVEVTPLSMNYVEEKLRAKMVDGENASRFVNSLISPSVMGGLWSVLFLGCCAILCLDLGLLLAHVDYRRPLIALSITLLAALVLQVAATRSVALLATVGFDLRVTHASMFMLVFALGQVSAFALRLGGWNAESCPVCLSDLDHRDVCAVCEAKVPRVRGTMFRGNRQSRELHHPECHHADRLTAANVQVFTSLDEAYWAGYQNCASCLGGKGA